MNNSGYPVLMGERLRYIFL